MQGPFFNDEFGDTYSLIFALTSDGFGNRELRDYAERVRAELLGVPDVAKIDLLGTQDEKIYLEFSNSAARRHGARRFPADADPAGAERHPAQRHAECGRREDRGPRLRPVHLGREPQGRQFPRSTAGSFG